MINFMKSNLFLLALTGIISIMANQKAQAEDSIVKAQQILCQGQSFQDGYSVRLIQEQNGHWRARFWSVRNPYMDLTYDVNYAHTFTPRGYETHQFTAPNGDVEIKYVTYNDVSSYWQMKNKKDILGIAPKSHLLDCQAEQLF